MFNKIIDIFKAKKTVEASSVVIEEVPVVINKEKIYHDLCGVGRSVLLNDDALIKWLTYKSDVLNYQYKSKSVSTSMMKLGSLGNQMSVVESSISNNWQGFHDVAKNRKVHDNARKATVKQIDYINLLIKTKNANVSYDVNSISCEKAKASISELLSMPDYIAKVKQDEAAYYQQLRNVSKAKHVNDNAPSYHEYTDYQIKAQEARFRSAIENKLKCESNRAILHLSNKEIIELCSKTNVTSIPTIKSSRIAGKFYAKGYCLPDLSLALFGNRTHFTAKLGKEESRYHGFSRRLLNILPRR